jgi:Secretion system C-terminal sorting domain/Metallo-peptidase family M12B Reprolysin-like
MLWTNLGIAQNPNIDLFDLQSSNTRLTTSQNTKMTKMRGEAGVKDVKLIRISDISKIQKNGRLTLRIPGTNLSFKAKATGVEKKSDGTLIWNGNMEGDEFGYFQYVQKGRDCLINFTYGTNSFQVVALGDGLHALKTLDVKKIPNGGCGIDHKKEKVAFSPQNPQNEVLRQEFCPDNTIRVLILFTPAAALEQGGNINVLPTACINQLNQQLINSGIQQRQVELAGAQEFNFVETEVDNNFANFAAISAAISGDINRLANDPRITNITTGLRNRFSADIVVLLTRREYFSPVGGEILGTVLPDAIANRTANNGFMLLTAESAIQDQQFTFAHEFGHVVGAQHQRCPDFIDLNRPFPFACIDATSPFDASLAKAFDFRSRGVDYKTTLHSSSNRSIRWESFGAGSDNIFYFRIPKYSNPAIRHPTASSSSARTGAARENNANQISLDFFIVRDYLPSNGTLNTYISGSYTFDPSNTLYEAVTRCGCSPFTFQWFFSTDGFNETFISSDETVLIGQPGFLRLVTTSCDGQTSTAFFTIVEDNCVFCPLLKATNSVQEQNNFYNPGGKISSSMMVYPNPTAESTTIDYGVSNDGNVKIDLLDISSKMIKSILNENMSAGYYRTELNTLSLENGVYLIRTQIGNDVFTQKLSILK